MQMISVDPGKNFGYAIFPDITKSDVYSYAGVLYGEDQIWSWIAKQRPGLWVVEDYRIRDEKHKGFDHIWQSVFPAQVIGAIKFFAYNTGATVILQQAAIKPAASKRVFGKPYIKSNKKSQHQLDAVLHGLYYLKTKGEK
jgi:hypothetical protein